MAHDRGPDVVMNIRYAGHSEIGAVTDHENNRSADGFSAIDPLRTHLNQILHGPSNQQKALDEMWEKKIRKPAQQSEKPYVQMVISASPEFFRGDDFGRGEWDQSKLHVWVKETMVWLRKEYGDDLAHVSLHLDEDTPHFHILIVPTYLRKTRRPSQRIKSGETDQQFADRMVEWESDGASTRTAGRSSSEYWSKMWCRRDARKSYHAAVVDLGLGYGKDFIGAKEPSPQHKTTGKWVREEAVRLQEERHELDSERALLDARSLHIDRAETKAHQIVTEAKIEAKGIISEAENLRSEVEADCMKMARQMHNDMHEIATQKSQMKEAFLFAKSMIRTMAKKLGFAMDQDIRDLFEALKIVEKRISELTDLPRSKPEDDDHRASPGF
jgi:vacuolar-type H+-ATPase subunit H